MLVAIFFQAEDGIRDHCVTGVQTCALPISSARLSPSTQLAVRYANEPTTPAAYTWRIAGWSRAASVSVSRRNQARPGESGARCTCKATERFSTRSHRSEEHTSELQSHSDIVCRLTREKKKNNT